MSLTKRFPSHLTFDHDPSDQELQEVVGPQVTTTYVVWEEDDECIRSSCLASASACGVESLRLAAPCSSPRSRSDTAWDRGASQDTTCGQTK
jgi:hypothetical protein